MICFQILVYSPGGPGNKISFTFLSSILHAGAVPTGFGKTMDPSEISLFPIPSFTDSPFLKNSFIDFRFLYGEPSFIEKFMQPL